MQAITLLYYQILLMKKINFDSSDLVQNGEISITIGNDTPGHRCARVTLRWLLRILFHNTMQKNSRILYACVHVARNSGACGVQVRYMFGICEVRTLVHACICMVSAGWDYRPTIACASICIILTGSRTGDAKNQNSRAGVASENIKHPWHEPDCTFRVSFHSQKAFEQGFFITLSVFALCSSKKQWLRRKWSHSKQWRPVKRPPKWVSPHLFWLKTTKNLSTILLHIRVLLWCLFFQRANERCCSLFE